MAWAWAVGASVLVSLVSLVGIFVVMLNEKFLKQILLSLIALSAGGLIGGAFFHLLPEALERIRPLEAGVFLLLGYGLFFVMERYLRWRHCHKGECSVHPFTYLSLIGDSLHNVFDGIVIGSSFVLGTNFGIAMTGVIILHEIPQEIGDFAVLIYGGMTKIRALIFNFLTALTAIAGALLGCHYASQAEAFLSVMLPFAAGGFIYVASCDLIPELHKEPDIKKATLSMVFFILGVLLMLGLKLAFQH